MKYQSINHEQNYAQKSVVIAKENKKANARLQ